MTKQVHFIMQGKGGVGKTLISTILTQYLLSIDKKVLCLDTDPVNKSFTRFKSLNVDSIPLLKNDSIDPHNFDLMVEKIITSDVDAVVVDSGASTFIPINKYIASCNLFGFLKEADCSVCLHSVIAGGQSADDTLMGVAGILSTYSKFDPAPEIAIWMNSYNGDIQWKGKGFIETNTYIDHKEAIKYLIDMPNLDPMLFGKDFELLLKSGHTFAEAMQDDTITLMSKHRIKTVKDRYFAVIQAAGIN